MIRPQTKRQKQKEEMRATLKKGDKVVTMGGIYGTVQGFKEKGSRVVLKIDNNTDILLNICYIMAFFLQDRCLELPQNSTHHIYL